MSKYNKLEVNIDVKLDVSEDTAKQCFKVVRDIL